jgi:hypothetical protein
VKHAQQLLEDSSGKDGNVTSPAGVAGGGRDDGVKRKRNAPRGSHHSGGGGAAAPADEEETVDTQRRKALRPQATGPIKSQHADGSEGRARTSRYVVVIPTSPRLHVCRPPCPVFRRRHVLQVLPAVVGEHMVPQPHDHLAVVLLSVRDLLSPLCWSSCANAQWSHSWCEAACTHAWACN